MSASYSDEPPVSRGAPIPATASAWHPPAGYNGGTFVRRRANSSVQLNRRSIHFSVNAWVLILAITGTLPFTTRQLQNKAYKLSLLGSTCLSFYSLLTLYGIPQSLEPYAIQAWFQTVAATKNFIQLMFSLMFFSSKLNLKIVLVPVICWSLEQVAWFLRTNFTYSQFYRQYLASYCIWVEFNTIALNTLASIAEILLGFLLLISTLSWQRNVPQIFMYWQLLKVMYHSPVTAGYHRNLWAFIGRTVNPYLNQYAPFISTPLSAILRWWFRQ